jgi:hypothetical protein
MSSQIGKTRQLGTWFFSLLQRALPIDAPNHPALLGDARERGEKICEIKFRRSKIVPHRLMAQGASLRHYSLHRQQK